MSLTFQLENLDGAATLDVSASLPLAPATILFGCDAVATLADGITLTDMKGLLQFKTDASDLSGGNVTSSDVQYRLKGLGAADWPLIQLSDADVVQTDQINTIYSDQKVKHDMVRYQAKEITGGFSAADIFINEADMVADISSANAEVQTSINSRLDNSGGLVNAIGAHILQRMLSDDDRAQSVADNIAAVNAESGGSPGWVELPFEQGDSINFKVTYTPISDPTEGVIEAAVEPRSYEMQVTLSA